MRSMKIFQDEKILRTYSKNLALLVCGYIRNNPDDKGVLHKNFGEWYISHDHIPTDEWIIIMKEDG